MTDQTPSIHTGRNFSAIWVIPIIAVLIGAALVLHTKLSEGPNITISFKTAEGLMVGKTKVKLLNLEVGVVESIELQPDISGVNVTVKLDREASNLLRDDTEFWVVRVRIGTNSISGLGTLLGGAYIELAPGIGKPGKRHFVGLEKPPQTPAGAPGLRLTLFNDNAGSVSTGDAVLYQGYKVGRVEDSQFDTARNRVSYDIFIDAPFNELVTTSTRFWNISGISIKASAEGFKINTGSIDTILQGGVEFRVPEGQAPGDKVTDGTEFKLYNSDADIAEQPFQYKLRYVVSFEQSVKGLLPGAPVNYRGIPIGKVERIMIKELVADEHDRSHAIPVLISVEPALFGLEDSAQAINTLANKISDNVQQGLRATLETGNLLTGSLYINFSYYDKVAPATIGEFSNYPTLPSIPSAFGRIENQISDVLAKLNALPLDNTVAEINAALASVNAILNNTNTREMTAELNATLAELQQFMHELSPQLQTGFGELNDTLSNLKEVTRTLKDKPNALILPTDFPADPEPKAKSP